MYVDIDSRHLISIHSMNASDALLLFQAIQDKFINYPDPRVRDRMMKLSKELLHNFKEAGKNGRTGTI